MVALQDLLPKFQDLQSQLQRDGAVSQACKAPTESFESELSPYFMSILDGSKTGTNWGERSCVLLTLEKMLITKATTADLFDWEKILTYLPRFILDGELRVRTALGKAVEAIYRYKPEMFQTEGHQVFYNSLLRDITDGYERKNHVQIVPTKSQTSEQDKSQKARLLPPHLATKAFDITRKTEKMGKVGATVEDVVEGVECEEIDNSTKKVEEIQGPLGPHESEGWGTLESSMGVLSKMLRGLSHGEGKNLFILDDKLVDLLRTCAEHKNRFVREYALLALADCIPLLKKDEVESLFPLLKIGLCDNWSQVKYASSTATRSCIQHPEFDVKTAAPVLVPWMCLNRHYVAEGVRLYSNENWKILNPQGGVPLIISVLPEVVTAYCDSTNAPNHAVREAACRCILELSSRVAGTPSNPSPFRDSFTPAIREQLVDALLSAMEDESWPVRDHAAVAAGFCADAFPEEFTEEKRKKLLELLFFGIGDNIPSLRKNVANSLSKVVALWGLHEEVFPTIDLFLKEGEDQSMDSASFSQYTPSGPFSVPQQKQTYDLGKLQDQVIAPRFENQTMYSCGSSAPRNFKKFQDGGGCMNCTVHGVVQPWERAEGAIHVVADLCRQVADAKAAASVSFTTASTLKWLTPERLSERMKVIEYLFKLSHFPHHCQMKVTVIERLADVVASKLWEIPESWLRHIEGAGQQTEHKAMSFAALDFLDALKTGTIV